MTVVSYSLQTSYLSSGGHETRTSSFSTDPTPYNFTLNFSSPLSTGMTEKRGLVLKRYGSTNECNGINYEIKAMHAYPLWHNVQTDFTQT